jgi:hypothetical protein
VGARPYRRAARFALAAGLLLAVGAVLLRFDLLRVRGFAEIERALTGRGRVAVAGPSSWLSIRPTGAQLVPVASEAALARALERRDPAALLAAIAGAGIDALLLQPGAPGAPDRDSLHARLGRYEGVEGLRALYLSHRAALYARDPVDQLPEAHRQATAVVARAIIGGARPPKTSSFPESLRRLRPVEVMVLLRRGQSARLWRSARGSSIASALVTAAVVARQRWQEREQAMGGPLAEHLPRMDVEIALLEDDGTVAERDPAFIDRVFGAQHGVGYERKGAWRYLLPEATAEQGKGRASRAYRKLFADDGLQSDSLEHSELRLYRLLVRTLAVSRAEPPRQDGVSPVRAPEEVLGAAPE